MVGRKKTDGFSAASSLDTNEIIDIDRKIHFELNEMQFKMIKLGGITNIIAGLLLIRIFYDGISLSVLLGWYAALVLVNIINISFSYYYQYSKVPPEQIIPWIRTYHGILAALCLTWGAIGVLFHSSNMHLQLYLVIFLLVVLMGFSFGTVTDFAASCISIGCLLLPYISFHVYLGISSIVATGHDAQLNLGSSLILFILGVFLLAAGYIGYMLIKKSFKLSFENVALSHKLENMNKFLEQRVKERTLELENSLKLVSYQATHDLLTDLPNQRLLFDYMQSAIELVHQNRHHFAITFFSLNEMERITDGLGHQAGEQVIKTIAHRFKQMFEKMALNNLNTLRYTVSLSRKDTFVILIEPIFKLEELEERVEILFSVLEEPVHIDKQTVKLTASIGVSVYPKDGKDIKELLMNADMSMLRAKQQGGNTLNIYKAEIHEDFSKQLEIENYLHDALKNNEFKLQYQPFVDLKTGQICGMEALARWSNPALGFISPADFIPLAEANGIIIPLGEWVLRTACYQTKAWHDQGFDTLKVAVNLSAKQLQQKNIIKVIERVLKETGLKPEYLELELTETEAFQGDTIPTLKQFKAMGLGLSIDDFGTGYSGLSNLKLFAIDKLKIDKSFVRDLATNSDSKAIVSNTIRLAKKIKVKVLAEGVETKEQLKFLKENDCDMIQGYYFSPPVNPNVFAELLAKKTQFTV